MKKYVDYIIEEAKKILSIDSPTGYTGNAADYVMEEYEKLGYCPVKTEKGGVVVDLGGKEKENAVMLTAHIDTLGAMVAEIKSNGRLRLTRLGGMEPNNGEAENCRVITRSGKIYEGTFQLNNASIHVNKDYGDTKRSYYTMELVLDEYTSSKEETEKLGIITGDIVAFEPRTRVTERGYIKSRFLDDKLSVAILLGFAKYIKENGATPERKIYSHTSVYEEVGHGVCGAAPRGVVEMLSVDMGCVGDGLACTERQVSICAKDSRGPYHYDVVGALIETARKAGIDYAVDVYPHYGSDADGALAAGFDMKHGLIGPGVYASHGYERSHIDGVEQTLRLLNAYLL